MNKQIPFLIRRGDIYNFRISVPIDLRDTLGCREITKSLRSSIKQIALPIALELAAISKRLFYEVRNHMSNNSDDSEIEISKLKHEIFMRKILRQVEAKNYLEDADIKIELARKEEKARFADILLDDVKLKKSNMRVDDINPFSNDINSPPLLSTVINTFLNDYSAEAHPEMYKKHMTVLPAFLEVTQDKTVNKLKQADINDFFKVVQSLPPRWSDLYKKKRVTIRDIAKATNPIVIAPKTFKSTYVASIRAFLLSSITNYQDQGFPATLTTKKVEYKGTRKIGENKQRAFTNKELIQLFTHPLMLAFKENIEESQKFWLPFIGLYTGARVNEICQLNPQIDIKQSTDSNIWYFDIDENSDADERIKKSTKNEVSQRLVPIHSELIKQGFLDYFQQIKSRGSKLLFPAFSPSKGKASGEAEKWFRKFIKEIGLRDDTPGKKLLGMHAFRSTFSNKAMNVGVNESSIVGHVGYQTNIEHSYRGELDLPNKKKIIEQIKFDL